MSEFQVRDRHYLEQLEKEILSPVAARSSIGAKTRLHEEEEHAYRTAFQRDRDRIIHSRAFRRLKHKRQVFLVTYGDHYRTRITHTIEVAQLSRTIARALGLNEDLTEAIALGHDLGHTPFGHIGEVVLHKIMKGHDDLGGSVLIPDAGGFKHNYQSVRIVDTNEMKYGFRGLNLTAQVREGILKHTRLRRHDLAFPDFETEGLHYHLDHATTLEGQIVAVCDEIAQRTHDLEDGLRAQHVNLEQVRQVDLVRLVEEKYGMGASLLDDPFLYRNRLIRKLVDFLVTDVIETTKRNIRAFVRQEKRTFNFDRRLVWFSDSIDPMQHNLDTFIMRNIILVAAEERSDSHAEQVISTLFKLYFQYPNLLPLFQLQKCFSVEEIESIYQNGNYEPSDEKKKAFARIICDHVAGMTDQYALHTWQAFEKQSPKELSAYRAEKEDRL